MTPWDEVIQTLDFAFQPIVNIHTGEAYGFEALLRKTKEAGFASIDEVFDRAFAEGVLYRLEMALREKAIRKFTESGLQYHAHLFFNMDNRVLVDPDYTPGSTEKLLEQYGLENRLCFEISERHELDVTGSSLEILWDYRRQGFKVAVDDYGTGFAGLQLLYYTEPDFIKIDRFFVADIGTDSKKKHFVSNLLNNAHMLGSMVVAEGVETPKEFFECLDIGCDLAQGYLIQAPEIDASKLQLRYDHVAQLGRGNRRERSSDRNLIASEIEFIEPVRLSDDVFEVFQRFQTQSKYNFFPVINQLGEPVGLVRENSFKAFAYSRFGRELLQNRSHRRKLLHFMEKIPTVDVNFPAERILEIFSMNKDIECILVMEHHHYVGLLGARSLLRILHEKNLALARDQNPLTRLPGNNMIFEFLTQALGQGQAHSYSFVYFDFDKFKPYNDRYGFRQGDRVILRFSEILKQAHNADLVAHVGGDDFFLGFCNLDPEMVEAQVREIAAQFHHDVESFYDRSDLERGSITATDRNGMLCEFPVMRVSAAILHLPSGSRRALDALSNALAQGKKRAKESPLRFWAGTMEDVDQDNSSQSPAKTSTNAPTLDGCRDSPSTSNPPRNPTTTLDRRITDTTEIRASGWCTARK